MTRFVRNTLGFLRSTLVPIERITAGVAVIDTNHAQIHAANAFSLAGELSPVAAGARGAVMIQVPAGVYVHLQALSFNSSAGPARVVVYEDATMTGTQIARLPSNHHRLRPNASELVCHTSLAATKVDGPDVETLVTLPLHGSAQGNVKVNAESGDPEEWILQPGTTYLAVLENNSSDPINFGYNFFWYEEDGA